MNEKGIYNTNPNITIHRISDDTYVLTDIVNGNVFEINETTKMIWNALKKEQTPLEIVSTLREIAINPKDIDISFIKDIISFFLENNIVSLAI